MLGFTPDRANGHAVPSSSKPTRAKSSEPTQHTQESGCAQPPSPSAGQAGRRSLAGTPWDEFETSIPTESRAPALPHGGGAEGELPESRHSRHRHTSPPVRLPSLLLAPSSPRPCPYPGAVTAIPAGPRHGRAAAAPWPPWPRTRRPRGEAAGAVCGEGRARLGSGRVLSNKKPKTRIVRGSSEPAVPCSCYV